MTLVSKTLEPTGCRVLCSIVDADSQIAVTDANEPLWKVAMIIGEDTDLLIVMLFYSRNQNSFKTIYKSDKEVT